MQFRENTPVYTADGQEVGAIDRVVINPETTEVSHIVVRQGWLFTEDKVVPTEWVDQATADQVRLRADVDNLDESPAFEETHYLPYEDGYGADGGNATTSANHAAYAGGGDARPYYPYPPIGATWPGYYGAFGYGAYAHPMGYYAAGIDTDQPYTVETERNIPEGAIALRQGATVVDKHGDQVGTMERVFTDDETQQVTHMLITEGWIFKEKHLVPTYWIRDATDEEVQLKVDADFLKRLPAYRS